jgi:uncharacterized Zn-finger protein
MGAFDLPSQLVICPKCKKEYISDGNEQVCPYCDHEFKVDENEDK